MARNNAKLCFSTASLPYSVVRVCSVIPVCTHLCSLCFIDEILCAPRSKYYVVADHDQFCLIKKMNQGWQPSKQSGGLWSQKQNNRCVRTEARTRQAYVQVLTIRGGTWFKLTQLSSIPYRNCPLFGQWHCFDSKLGQILTQLL